MNCGHDLSWWNLIHDSPNDTITRCARQPSCRAVRQLDNQPVPFPFTSTILVACRSCNSQDKFLVKISASLSFVRTKTIRKNPSCAVCGLQGQREDIIIESYLSPRSTIQNSPNTYLHVRFIVLVHLPKL